MIPQRRNSLPKYAAVFSKCLDQEECWTVQTTNLATEDDVDPEVGLCAKTQYKDKTYDVTVIGMASKYMYLLKSMIHNTSNYK